MTGQLEQKKELGLINGQGQRGGAICRLAAVQQEQLRHLLSQQDFWTRAQIAQLVLDRFQLSYSQQELRQLLKPMKLYHYKPQPRHHRQSPMAHQQLQERLRATGDGLALGRTRLKPCFELYGRGIPVLNEWC